MKQVEKLPEMFTFLKLFVIFNLCRAVPQQGTRGSTDTDIYFTISATNLRGEMKDPDGEVDPFVNVYLGIEATRNSTDNNALEKIGTSETVEDDNNPRWNTVFKVRHIPGNNQVIHLIVRDYDPLSRDDALVYAAFRLDDFVTRGEYATRKGNSKSSGVTVKQTTPIYLDLTLKGIPLQDKWVGASDLYVMCYCTDGDGHNFLFYRTVMIGNAQEASFKSIPFLNYKRGSDQVVRFEVFDYDTFTPDDPLGSVEFNIDSFMVKGQSAIFSLAGPATLTVSLSGDV